MFYDLPFFRVYEFRCDCLATGYRVKGMRTQKNDILYNVFKNNLPIVAFGLKDDEIEFYISLLDQFEPQEQFEVRYHQRQIVAMAVARRLIPTKSNFV